MTIPAAETLKEYFYQGACSCGATIAILPRKQFPCFLKGRLIGFAGKRFGPAKSLATFLALHELLQNHFSLSHYV